MIQFYSEDIDFHLDQVTKVSDWLITIITSEKLEVGDISIIFCSDKYLLEMNIKHLNHNYYTDIITFEYMTNPVSGDLFISIDRVKENARDLNTGFDTELNRVIIHGLLHIMGYKDKTEEDKTIMRAKENSCLALYLV